jgi:IclR family pca regulon transcriptional regulator
MAGRGRGPDVVGALARGLDVLARFDADHRSMSLTEVATAAQLAQPTARSLLLTLEELCFVRSAGGAFPLTPKVLSLGIAYVGALGLWDIACRTWRRSSPAPASRRRWRSSTARTSSTSPGRRYRKSSRCAWRSARGSRRADLPGQGAPGRPLPRSARRDPGRAEPVGPARAGRPVARPAARRTDGDPSWGLGTGDEELAPGVRSVVVPVRDRDGAVQAAMNVTVHAVETTTEQLRRDHCRCCSARRYVGAEWALCQSRPHSRVARRPAGSATASCDTAAVGCRVHGRR